MFNLMPTPYKLAMAAMVLFTVALGAYMYGKVAAAKEYIPQIEKLKASIDAADEQAKTQIKQQEIVKNGIKKNYAANVSRIQSYYDGLLHTGGQASASSVAGDTVRIDAPSCEQDATGKSIAIPDYQFERACVEDASKVDQWQTWAIKNNFPIE